MRPARLAMLLFFAWTGGDATAQEVHVEGFHGYEWGTSRVDILELAGSEQVGEKDGLAIYSSEIVFEGREGLAGFYFHPETGALVEGAYVFTVPLAECDRIWGRIARAVVSSYPDLERLDSVPSRTSAPRPVYDSDCEYFVYNAHKEVWWTELRDGDPATERVRLSIRAIERSPRLTVLYQGRAAREWANRDR